MFASKSRLTVSNILLGCVFALVSQLSHAGLLGQGISDELGYDPSGGPFDPGYFTQIGPINATVGAGQEFSGFFGSNVDFGDTTYHATFNSGHGAAGFNGFIYRLTDPGAPDFLTVTFVGSSIAGFNASRVHFKDDAIAIDLGGLGANGFIDLTFTTGNAVPEPATLALLALGLAGFGASRRRKQ